jgi:hypothetical protein
VQQLVSAFENGLRRVHLRREVALDGPGDREHALLGFALRQCGQVVFDRRPYSFGNARRLAVRTQLGHEHGTELRDSRAVHHRVRKARGEPKQRCVGRRRRLCQTPCTVKCTQSNELGLSTPAAWHTRGGSSCWTRSHAYSAHIEGPVDGCGWKRRLEVNRSRSYL